MNIGFVLSSCIWSIIIGRVIAFGPVCTVFTWFPQFPPDSWYRLTDIRGRMPPKLVQVMPWMLIAFAVPGLLVNSTLVHSIVVLMMVNEQTYLPVFTTRVYDSVVAWPLVTMLANALLAITLRNHVVIATLVAKSLIFLWFAWIEFSIRGNLVREELPYQERQPRTV